VCRGRHSGASSPNSATKSTIAHSSIRRLDGRHFVGRTDREGETVFDRSVHVQSSRGWFRSVLPFTFNPIPFFIVRPKQKVGRLHPIDVLVSLNDFSTFFRNQFFPESPIKFQCEIAF
jgi:hypothetical protein